MKLIPFRLSEEEEYQLACALEGNSNDPWANRMVMYYVLAREFGWTPAEVDNIPRRVILALLYLIKEQYDRLESEIGWQNNQVI